jgi:DNA modification methylase
MDPESVDVCLTSPPYNLGIKYSAYYDGQPRDEYLCWLRWVFNEIARLLKPDGHFFLNVAGKPSDPWVAMDVAQVARRYFFLQNEITWVKSISIGGKATGTTSRSTARGILITITSRSFTSRARVRSRSIGWQSACPFRIRVI